ncbi:MAG TPA: SDR family oxidoreductase [Burkholderiaceae bacterium]|nr:SDR family oxidoreductase [Burkholderiaceae bacterium]
MATVVPSTPAKAQTDIEAVVAGQEHRWLLTGSAGFIGSHLLETLLLLGQRVTSLDNFATGHRANLEQVRERVGAAAWAKHVFLEADIADAAACRAACDGIDVVLHEAALGSVPRSLQDPLASHRANVTGFLNMLVASRDAGVRRFVYAASSSTYGDHPNLPKVEDAIGRPLSPYAATKLFDEIYAEVFGRCYGTPTIGLRYFNVFGPRQDPNGPYAAVIPRWAAAIISGKPCVINGDGETSRDFCYVANAVQANLRAALVKDAASIGQVYNVAVGTRTTLKQLHEHLATALQQLRPQLRVCAPQHAPFRAGDVRHSEADIGKARRLLGYEPRYDLRAGLKASAPWYLAHANAAQ